MNPVDENFFTYPTNITEYKQMTIDMVNIFTSDQCYKICRTLDMLHSTYEQAIQSKLNAGFASGAHGTAQMNQINLFNYLKSLPGTTTLYSALFKDIEGVMEGLLLFTPPPDGGRSILSQVVDPKVTQEQARARIEAHNKYYSKKNGNGAHLVPDANSWIKKDSPTIKEYLDGETDPIIIDKLAKSKEGELKFSSRLGDVEINVRESKRNNLVPKSTWVVTEPFKDIMFGLEADTGYFLGDPTDATVQHLTEITRYLPYYQAWERQMEAVSLARFKKPENMIPEEKGWDLTIPIKKESKWKGITPMILKQGNGGCNDAKNTWRAPFPLLFCVLCGCELDKDEKGCYIMDIDHTQNLIVNSAFDLNDSVHGFFNTCGVCNRNFKKAKIFTPNLGVWRLLRTKGGVENPNDFNEYPGKKFGMFGVGGKYNKKMPYGGARVFNIGYRSPHFRTLDWAAAAEMDGGDKFKNFADAAAATSSGSSSSSQTPQQKQQQKEEDDLKESEGLNNTKNGSKKENGGECLFNEFDLQLKFLKRILHIAEKLEENHYFTPISNEDIIGENTQNIFFSRNKWVQELREAEVKDKMLKNFETQILLLVNQTLEQQQLSQSQNSTAYTNNYTKHIRIAAEKIFGEAVRRKEITEDEKNDILALVFRTAHELTGADIAGTIKLLSSKRRVERSGSTVDGAFTTDDISKEGGISRLQSIQNKNEITHGALQVAINSISGLIQVVIKLFQEKKEKLPKNFKEIMKNILNLKNRLHQFKNDKTSSYELKVIDQQIALIGENYLEEDDLGVLYRIEEDLEEEEPTEFVVGSTQQFEQKPTPKKKQSSSSSSSKRPYSVAIAIGGTEPGSNSNKMARKDEGEEDMEVDCKCDTKVCTCNKRGGQKRTMKRRKRKKRTRTKKKNLKGTKRKTRKKYRKKNYSSKSSS